MEAVRFEDVSKRFILHHERARTFQEAALNLFKLQRTNDTREEFWALQNVSFAVERGRTLGIVGRNGSGKSTLLKLLTGTMRPTSGRVVAHGRIFGLLELAAGFHPELSGRDNVFLNGTFLGLSRRQMAARLEQIVAFAELEQFIDTPVKHYSSGMYMRLGFAIALSVDPDILVVDEVLAVGDAAFRQKCFLALADFKARQKTILFVTHDAAAVRRFCDEALWLNQGRVQGAGPADAVLRDYLSATQTKRPATDPSPVGPARLVDPLSTPRGPLSLLSVHTVDERGQLERHFQSGQRFGVRVRFQTAEPLEEVSLGIALHRGDGLYLWSSSTAGNGTGSTSTPAGEGQATCWLDTLPLAAAEYTVSAAAWLKDDPAPQHRLAQAARFAVRPPRKDQAGLLALAPCWTAAGSFTLTPAPAASPTQVAAGPGSADDQALPMEGFRARWRQPPSRVAMGEGEDEFLGGGWYPPEDWPPRVRWTSRRASVYLTQDEWTSGVGVTMCRPQHNALAATGRVSVNGRLAGRFELSAPTPEPFVFPVEAVEAPQEVEIALEIDRPLEPAATGASDDHRTLGVAVREIWLE